MRDSMEFDVVVVGGGPAGVYEIAEEGGPRP